MAHDLAATGDSKRGEDRGHDEVGPSPAGAEHPERGGDHRDKSEDVATAILYAVTQPPHVNVNVLTLYPTQQA